MKLLVAQSCPALCDQMDCSLLGSSVHGILQARLLEWVVVVQSLSCGWLSVTPWTVAHQAPLSMEFSRQDYWSGLPFPTPRDLPDPEIKPRSSALQAESLLSEPPTESTANTCTWLTLFCISICEKILFSFNFHFFLLHLFNLSSSKILPSPQRHSEFSRQRQFLLNLD